MKISVMLLVVCYQLNMHSVAAIPCPTTPLVETRPWNGPKLIQAIIQSDVEAVKAMIAAGVALNERDNQGNTPLVAALTPRARLEPAAIVSDANRKREIQRESTAQSAIVPLLLAKGADPNAPGAHGRTPLMQVSAWGNSRSWDRRTATTLVSLGAKVDAADVFGNTALLLASERHKPDLVQLLAKHGANPMVKNCHGESAMSVARAKNFTDVVQMLESALRAKPNSHPTDPRGRVSTPP